MTCEQLKLSFRKAAVLTDDKMYGI